MKINILLEPNRLTVGDMVELESGKFSTRFMRDFLARFVVDEQGEYLAKEKAVQAINELNLNELTETVQAFQREVVRLQETLVPEAISGS